MRDLGSYIYLKNIETQSTHEVFILCVTCVQNIPNSALFLFNHSKQAEEINYNTHTQTFEVKKGERFIELVSEG